MTLSALIYSLVLPALLLLGLPIYAVLLIAAIAGFYANGVELTAVAVEIYRLVDMPLLVSLPLFTFAGYLLSEGRASHRLLALSNALLGWVPGGTSLVVIIACALFTAFTGASGVTILALGALFYPALVKEGYGEKLSLGLITTTGSLGLLLPPSIPLIIYGIIMQQMHIGTDYQLDDLFVAGIGPALLMIILVALSVYLVRGRQHKPHYRFSGAEIRQALQQAAWDLPLPFIVFAGIFSGVLAISEVAAVTVLYVLFIELLVYRDIRPQQLPAVAVEAMTMIGGILLILAAAMVLTNFLIDQQVPDLLFQWIKQHVQGKVTFLLLLNLFLLLVGTVLDIFSALVIIAPLILPVAVGYGIDPLHLGVIFLANMQIGYFTPPVGMNLFIASFRFNRSIIELYHASLPFMLVFITALAIITYVPALSLFLVG